MNLSKIDIKQSQKKKLVTLRYSDLINCLINDDAYVKNETDSKIVEDILLQHYLHPDSDDVAWVEAHLLFEKNGISNTCAYIFSHYISHPEEANDTLIPLLEFILLQEKRYSTAIRTDDDKDNLYYIYETLGDYISILEMYLSDPTFKYLSIYNNDPEAIDKREIDYLKSIRRYCKDNISHLNNSGFLSELIRSIIRYWNVGTDGDRKLKNDKATFRLLHYICNLTSWPSMSSNRKELLDILNSISFENKKKNENINRKVALTKVISIKGRKIKTTDNAIILKPNKDVSDSDYTHARRLEYLYDKKMLPYFPCIVLFNDADIDQIDNIVIDLAIEYAFGVFPDVKHVITAPIIEDGLYVDSRIQWLST